MRMGTLPQWLLLPSRWRVWCCQVLSSVAESGLTWIVLVERTKGILLSMVECAGHKRCNVPRTEGFSVPPRAMQLWGLGTHPCPLLQSSLNGQNTVSYLCNVRLSLPYKAVLDVLIELSSICKIEMCQLTHVSLARTWVDGAAQQEMWNVFFFVGKVVSSVQCVSRTPSPWKLKCFFFPQNWTFILKNTPKRTLKIMFTVQAFGYHLYHEAETEHLEE